MSSVTINYEHMSNVSKYAFNAASRMTDYIDDLSGKVISQYDRISGGPSSQTRESEYYISQKISRLKEKAKNYSNFAGSVKRLSTTAQEIDEDIAKKIKISKEQFIAKHDYISSNWWTDIKDWFIDLKNSCPLFEAIGNLIEQMISGFKNALDEFKEWYRWNGGKEIIGVVLAAAGAVASLVIAICSAVPPFTVVAVCAAIGAAIAAINAMVNVYTSYKAFRARQNGDPAWAKVYGDQDTLQDVLRQTNFGDGMLNSLSYLGAMGLDVVQIVCDFVAIYDGIRNVRNVFKEIKISARKGKKSFGSRLKNYAFNSKTYRDKTGMQRKWRDVLQERGKARTLRDYGVKYGSSLTDGQKLANSIRDYAKHGKNFTKYAQKFFDYFFDDEWSLGKTFEDIWSGINGKYETTDLIDKTMNFRESLKSLYHDFSGVSWSF